MRKTDRLVSFSIIVVVVSFLVSSLDASSVSPEHQCSEETINDCSVEDVREFSKAPPRPFGDYTVQISEIFNTCCICGYSCTEIGCECTGDGSGPDPWCDPECSQEKATIRNAKGDLIATWKDDDVEVVDLKRSDKSFAIFIGSHGASANWLRYVIYSVEPEFKKIGVIEDPINQYQATNRKCGGEDVPDGFYEDDEGNLLVDTLSLRAGYEDKSMPAREYDVVTLKVEAGQVSPVSRRPFEMSSYKRPGKLLEHDRCNGAINE